MELSLTSPHAPPQSIPQHTQSLTTTFASMSSANLHHQQMSDIPQLQQTGQLLLAHEHGSAHTQLHDVRDSVIEDVIDCSTSSNLVDQQMIAVSDHSQTHLSQNVRFTYIHTYIHVI